MSSIFVFISPLIVISRDSLTVQADRMQGAGKASINQKFAENLFKYSRDR